MRFKAQIHNVSTFSKFAASLASLGPVAWVRLSDSDVRFTVIPEQGTQVWSYDTVFETHTIQSAAGNIINLEIPIAQLHRALKSALSATSASIRLTKKDGVPILCLTITSSSLSTSSFNRDADDDENTGGGSGPHTQSFDMATGGQHRARETIVTQDIPIRVLSPESVEGIHEPRCREPDVHIYLPDLLQVKSISDRFTRMAAAVRGGSATSAASSGPRLEMAANMHGCLRLSIRTDSMNVSSVWIGLSHPQLDPELLEGGLAEHPSTRMKQLGSADGTSEEGWSTVRIDGKDWGKVMSVGRLGGRVIACFCDDHALILYVFLSGEDEQESVLTYYISSYSA
ncbi:checkpoint protein Hus1/Mec3 [Lineolata rhizophorae]|uniref:Checkpoint protein n=1 Tax=Lineolata rhizophorae TaxID=578093 RepID=A0A6A6PED7_9PEZI|nr:checkpoint protein Hus1/Mec3 [Lineolata rhizophorae]